MRFWRFRPLADFYGGPELASAAMRPAHAVRERVARWLEDHDAPTDHGRRGKSGHSSQLELDEMAREIESLAAARRVAAAAARARPDGRPDHYAQQAAMQVLLRHAA